MNSKPKPIKKILAAVDYSKKSLEAAEFALCMAKDMNSLLIVINVLQTEPWSYGKHAYQWGSKDKLDKVYRLAYVIKQLSTDSFSCQDQIFWF
jgi:nucleotide-binding universal stress UspA family protein